MTSNPKRYFTVAEYFALERVGDARYEYWQGDIVCMSGGSEAHGRISGNIYFILRTQLIESVCEPFNNDIPIKTPTLPPYRYPDISAACGKSLFENIGGIDVLINPVLIAEVLSPNTEQADRGIKFEAYQAIQTVQEYLLIAQNMPHVTHFVKQPNGEWSRVDTADLSATLQLNAIDCRLSVRDIYAGVEFK